MCKYPVEHSSWSAGKSCAELSTGNEQSNSCGGMQHTHNPKNSSSLAIRSVDSARIVALPLKRYQIPELFIACATLTLCRAPPSQPLKWHDTYATSHFRTHSQSES
eukprot:COSAG02_NODE_307_length_25111_cov_5.306693_20_plen_106_part_00